MKAVLPPPPFFKTLILLLFSSAVQPCCPVTQLKDVRRWVNEFNCRLVWQMRHLHKELNRVDSPEKTQTCKQSEAIERSTQRLFKEQPDSAESLACTASFDAEFNQWETRLKNWKALSCRLCRAAISHKYKVQRKNKQSNNNLSDAGAGIARSEHFRIFQQPSQLFKQPWIATFKYCLKLLLFIIIAAPGCSFSLGRNSLEKKGARET